MFRRKQYLDNLLTDYEPTSNIKQTYIFDEINNKFGKKLKYYEYVENISDLQLGQYIRYVHLDKNKLSMVGKITKIEINDSNNIEFIVLYDNIHDSFWKIRPNKYYIYVKNKNKQKYDKMFKELMGEYDFKVEKVKKSEIRKVIDYEIENHVIDKDRIKNIDNLIDNKKSVDILNILLKKT